MWENIEYQYTELLMHLLVFHSPAENAWTKMTYVLPFILTR
jgi:hypothetical protein